jgi:hypothetical protein
MPARVAGVALAAMLLLGAAFIADAEMIWLDRAKLLPDTGSAGTLTFTVTVQEGGSFAARILCQGEKGRKYLLELELRPEDGGVPQKAQFSFAGSGCD